MRKTFFKLLTVTCLVLGAVAFTAPGFIISDAHAAFGGSSSKPKPK